MRLRSCNGICFTLLLGTAACGAGASRTLTSGSDVEHAVATITAADLIDRIGVIAADSMRGRDTPSRELDQVAEWLAVQFQRLGLEPAFGDDYVQRYAIRRVAPDLVASRATLGGSDVLIFGTDLAFPIGPAAGLHEGGVMVLSGVGEWADRLAQTNVRGKHVVLVPPNAAFLRTREGRRLTRAVGSAGARSVLIVVDQSEAAFQRDAALQAQQTSLRLGEDAGTPTLSIRAEAARRVWGLDVEGLQQAAEQPMQVTPIPGATLSLDLRSRVLEETSAPNVAAVLRGSDPDLRDEYVLYSAHMDHVGVGAPVAGDSIWNGADDDASGTATVVEVAEAFSTLDRAPRRSMIFLLVSGEEKGLWGSGYFAEQPPVPMGAIVADLNVDMVGRNWPDTIVAIGREHSDLGNILATVNAAHPEIGMTAIDDIWPEESFYTRSDHFNFARRGVPILFFFNGTHPDYHRPSDEVDKIDGAKTERIARLLFYLGLEVAQRDARPQWNLESRARIVDSGV